MFPPEAVTQDFQLSVTPVGNNEFLLRIEFAAVGVPLAEEQVTWPIERWLHQARVLMQDPLLQMLQQNGFDDPDCWEELEDLGGFGDRSQPDRPTPTGDSFPRVPPTERRSRPAQDLVSLGRELYDALFYGNIRDRWMMAQAIAQHNQTPLRLRLGLKSAELNRLPWEALHDGDFPVAAGTQILFSRYGPTQNTYRLSPPETAPGAPLRILMAVSTPSDRAALDLPEETRSLVDELQAAPNSHTQFDLLEQPDRQTLTQALEGGRYHIFHYAGHSSSGRDGGEISLVSKKYGLTESLSGNDLAGMLANNGIQLAVFNSCRGAHRDGDDSGAYNLAEAAIERRIPAVLAMAERIPDEVALNLTRLFYRHLSQGVAIDLSLSRARQGLIASFGSRQFYWALPVFHLSPAFDGLLVRPRPDSRALGSALPPDLAALPIDTDARPVLPPRTAARPSLEPPPLADDLLPDRLLEDEALDLLGDATIERSGDSDRAADSPILEAADETDTDRPEANSPAATYVRSSIPDDRPPPPVGRGVETKRPRRSKLSGMAVPLAIGALVVGVGVSWRLLRTSTDRPPAAPAAIVTPGLNDIERQDLIASASAAIARGDVASSLPTIATLLATGDLDSANQLLLAMPSTALERGDVQFLKGRWAWQTRLSGSLAANYDDAQRYWSYAVDRDPDNLLYRTALGWAYYADGGDRAASDTAHLDDADRAWREALALLERDPEASIAGSELDRLAVSQSLQAGVALLLDRRNNRDRALELRDAILERDALALSPENLAKNWLWTDTAIGQWQTLLSATPPPSAP